MTDDTPKGQPALTPSEWAEKELGRRGKTSPPLSVLIDSEDGEIVIEGAWVDPDERHAIAALCLYGQPFGFSQEDVDALRKPWHRDECPAMYCAPDWQPECDCYDTPERAALRSLADRLAALLPPAP